MTLDQSHVNPELLSSLTLAFMGDAIIETYVREAVITASKAKIHRLHEQTISYVSAKAQSAYLHELIAAGFLTDQERDIVRKGRNVKPHTVPKNTDVQTYNFSTGFEALIGYLHFDGRKKRIDEIMEKMFILHPVKGGRNQ
jgi:ribonuclease-3 family protein